MNSVQLLGKIQNEDLLKKLIQQINKDFNLVGIEFYLTENSTPQFIVVKLQSLLEDLMRNNFKNYVNVMYRIDISEQKLLQLRESDINILSKKVTLLVLQREWQKVAFKK